MGDRVPGACIKATDRGILTRSIHDESCKKRPANHTIGGTVHSTDHRPASSIPPDDATGAQPAPLRLLVVEDSEADFDLLLHTLARQGLRCAATRVETRQAMRDQLAGQSFDAVICDHHLPSFSSGEAFEVLGASGLDLPFIIVSGTIGEEAAVAAMRLGADDYLIKGRLARLAAALRNAIAAAGSRRERREARAELARSQQALQALSGHLLDALEAERASIAREIHDEIGSGLTALQFDLAWIARHGGSTIADRAHRSRQQVIELMQAGQRLIRQLRPPVLDAGLVPAIEWQVRQARERTGLRIQLHVHGSDTDLDPDLALVCYRTLQESLTNISKHAQAGQASVSLVLGDQTVSLEVSDDGIGIKPDALDKPTSFGLRGLTERVTQRDGWLDVTPAERGGTTLVMSLPRRPAIPRSPIGANPEPEDRP